MIKADGGQWTARLCFWSVLSHSDAGLQVRESFSLVSKLVWRIELFCVPGRHPSGVHQKHQEDQNCHPVAKRSGDRHHKWQGERNLAASHHDLMNYEKTVFLHMWKSIPKDFFFYFWCCSTCLCPSCPETTPTSFWCRSVLIWRYERLFI